MLIKKDCKALYIGNSRFVMRKGIKCSNKCKFGWMRGKYCVGIMISAKDEDGISTFTSLHQECLKIRDYYIINELC